MKDVRYSLEELKKQEEEYVFASFTCEDALQLGLILVDKAKRENAPVAIDITRNGQQMFHFAFDAAAPDNDSWILGKSNTVNFFHCSSLYMEYWLEENQKDMLKDRCADPLKYRASGGSFPLTIKNVGIVGSITVSGLPSHLDHQLILDSLEEFLKNKNERSMKANLKYS